MGSPEPTFLLLPGFATDARVFGELPARLPGRTLAPAGFSPSLQLEEAAGLLRSLDRPATVIGWSLGARLALDLAAREPGRIERLILVGLRPRFPPEVLAAFRSGLAEDRTATLGRFFRECFLPSHREAFRRFRAGLEAAYLGAPTAAELDDGLRALARPAVLPDREVTLIHGSRDPIAPAAEVLALGRPVRLLPDAGHAAFAAPEFLAHV